MRKLVFILFFFAIFFSIFGNEKIIKLKFEIDGDSKFYPVDENGKMDYGFYRYKYKFFNQLITLEDETKEPLYGRVNLDIIEKLSKYNRGMINNAISTGLGFGFGAAFTFGGALNLYSASIRGTYINSADYLLNLSVGIIFLTGGIIEIILGIVSLGLTVYNCYNFKKVKKEIMDILNSIPVSIKTNNMRIKFVINLGFSSN